MENNLPDTATHEVPRGNATDAVLVCPTDALLAAGQQRCTAKPSSPEELQ